MIARPKEVPDRWKAPLGPYRQAPLEYGGEWWLVNPFNGPEPWLLMDRKPALAEVLPEGFEAIFGPRPQKTGYQTRRAWKHDVIVWERDKKNFKQAGQPPWASKKELRLAAEVLDAWGMGAPSYYEHRNWGWMAMFLDSQVEEFSMNAHTTVYYTHLVIANYQVRLLQEGIRPQVIHPLLSAGIRSDISEARTR